MKFIFRVKKMEDGSEYSDGNRRLTVDVFDFESHDKIGFAVLSLPNDEYVEQLGTEYEVHSYYTGVSKTPSWLAKKAEPEVLDEPPTAEEPTQPIDEPGHVRPEEPAQELSEMERNAIGF